MRKPYNPRPYQNDIISFELETPRCAVYASMGLGKTLATLTAIDALQLVEPDPVLVVAPLRVAQSTWPDEAAKWEHLRDITVSPVVGDVQARHAALLRKAQVYTTNYEQLPWLVEHLS